MNDHVTLLRPSAALPESGRVSALPDDLLDQGRSRVALAAVIVMIGAGAELVVVAGIWIYATLRGSALPADLVANAPLYLVSATDVTAAVVLWVIARRRILSGTELLTAGLLFEFVICFTISLAAFWGYYHGQGAFPKLTWVVPIIIMFPMIIPGPPRLMLRGALASALSVPLALAVLHPAGGAVEAAPATYLAAFWSPALAVVFSYLGAKVIYGLGRQVAEARQLGSYQLEEKLGQGGMGEVWRARHRMLARPAAIKLIRPDLLDQAGAGDSRGALARFEREAQATAQLRSPHTVELYDFGIAADGAFYYVMELLDGVDTDTLVQRFGTLPAERCVHVLRQACHSLSEAHSQGLIHRDIKPANLFLCRYGEEHDFVKVLDFGLVKSRGDGAELSDLTAANVVHGTPAFIAPEQALGGQALDGRVDVYALGCVAYWLLTGRLVFEGRTPMELMTHHVHTRPVPVSQRAEVPIPPVLDRLILACLEKDPAARPATPRELVAQLDAVDATLEPWTPERARRWWDVHRPATSGMGVSGGGLAG